MSTKTNATLLTVFFFFAMLTALQVQGQIPRDSTTGNYAYQGIIKVDSATKEQLYTHAKRWILKTLKSNDNIVQLDDKDFNSITGSGTIIMEKQGGGGPFAFSYDNARLNFKTTVHFKEGRLKYSFDNFSFSADKYFNGHFNGTVLSSLENLEMGKKEKAAVLTDTDTKMKALVSSFKNEVTAQTNPAKDDW